MFILELFAGSNIQAQSLKFKALIPEIQSVQKQLAAGCPVVFMSSLRICCKPACSDRDGPASFHRHVLHHVHG